MKQFYVEYLLNLLFGREEPDFEREGFLVLQDFRPRAYILECTECEPVELSLNGVTTPRLSFIPGGVCVHRGAYGIDFKLPNRSLLTNIDMSCFMHRNDGHVHDRTEEPRFRIVWTRMDVSSAVPAGIPNAYVESPKVRVHDFAHILLIDGENPRYYLRSHREAA